MAVPLIGLPSASVPLVVVVIVLPSFDMTVRPAEWYFPPVFFTSTVKVLAFICFMEMVSQGAPVAGYSLKQINANTFTVEVKKTGGIYLFHGDGIPRCSSGRVLLAIVF